LHPQIEAMPHHWQKMRAEELLLEAELDLTILQPTAYMQNLVSGWPEIAGAGIYRVPYPAATRLSLVDLDDVAEAAARVLTEPGHAGATYELVGTLPLSQTEVADTLAEALGRPVRVEAEPIQAWAARATGLGSYQRDTLMAMFRHYARHGLAGNPRVLGWLLSRPPATLAEFTRRATIRAQP
ncbi:MAG: NmrA family NAD(P)-binding protein, partial [Alphaproteobacteria bacterium]|nr:NmrA family NAD(P)-binding protein [Alphaproteobacteria bacterium]